MFSLVSKIVFRSRAHSFRGDHGCVIARRHPPEVAPASDRRPAIREACTSLAVLARRRDPLAKLSLADWKPALLPRITLRRCLAVGPASAGRVDCASSWGPSKSTLLSGVAALFVFSTVFAANDRPAIIPFPTDKPRLVSPSAMQRIYDEVKTPFKYGVVLRGEPGELIDCPNVFRHGDRWFMVYVANKEKVGYQTCLARSDDLLHWEKLGPILSFRRDGWDAWQAAGGLALYDTRWEGTHELATNDGRYWLSYLGGAKQGYEPDPLAIGLAHTDDPTAGREWTRLPENPMLAPDQRDARDFEHVTLYKSAIIRDETRALGAPFVMFYNGKSAPYGVETIGLAISDDLRSWRRFGHGPVVANIGAAPWAISGDPQLARVGEVWVMFYFGAFWKPGAFDTFACSYDLVHWSKWDGPHLVAPSEDYDKQFAHKPWLLKHDGIVYHFYCAVGSEGRVIALATSKDLRAPSK